MLNEAALLQGLAPVPTIHIMQRVRQLVQAIMSAAHLVIQATAGMRISEICSIPAGVNPATGLPTCIEIEDSLSSLGQLFILKSDLSKTEDTPRLTEWTVGYRPKGSFQLPPAVQAIMILEKLLAPYRTLLEPV